MDDFKVMKALFWLQCTLVTLGLLVLFLIKLN